MPIISRLSQMSAPSVANPNWTELELDWFEERAAIMEFDVGLHRSAAEYLARSLDERRDFLR